jgi:hypothetical protein
VSIIFQVEVMLSTENEISQGKSELQLALLDRRNWWLEEDWPDQKPISFYFF